MAIMRLETMIAIVVITLCNIMLFAGRGQALLARVAGGGAADPSRTQLPGNSCQISEEISSEDRFECGIEMSANFRPHGDPPPVRIVLTTTPFVLIQTPSALIKIRSALIKTPFALTTT